MAFALALSSERTAGLHQTASEKVDTPRQPLFRTNIASDSLLTSYGADGKPPIRKTWNWDDAGDRLVGQHKEQQERMGVHAKTHTSFTLKAVENRDWRLARSDTKKRTKGIDPFGPEPVDISKQRASISGAASLPAFLQRSETSLLEAEARPMNRADKYYQALLKAERARNEFYRREEWDGFLQKANKAAARAKKAALKREKMLRRAGKDDHESASEESEEEENDDDDEDPGPLQPYPGVMKVEVEVVVLRAPGVDKSETESSVDNRSTHTPSSASEKSEEDDGADWKAELQALQEEFGDKEKGEVEEEEDDLPDGLFGRRIGNVHDAFNKRTALGLGGTAFFVPEVERYAFAPSLLPPPPRGEGHMQQIGHKRLKLKPRLPLEVSRHRWRDEHPYGCPPEPEFSPDVDDLRSLEEKVRRVELYGTLNKIIHHMPKPDGVRRLPKTDDFERELDWELKKSVAWQQYIKRQRLIEIARAERAAAEEKKNGGEQLDTMVKGYKPGKPKDAARDIPKDLPPDVRAALMAHDPNSVPTTAEKKKRVKRQKGPFRPTPIPPHPGAPPAKMIGPPAFQVGEIVLKPKSPPRSCRSGRAKSSPPSSPGTAVAGALAKLLPPGNDVTTLMSVAPGVRQGSGT